MSFETMKLSELKVLRSPAGYYIGRQYWDEEFEMWAPGTRECPHYFASEELAQEAFNTGFPIRDCIENQSLYIARPDIAADTMVVSRGKVPSVD